MPRSSRRRRCRGTKPAPGSTSATSAGDSRGTERTDEPQQVTSPSRTRTHCQQPQTWPPVSEGGSHWRSDPGASSAGDPTARPLPACRAAARRRAAPAESPLGRSAMEASDSVRVAEEELQAACTVAQGDRASQRRHRPSAFICGRPPHVFSAPRSCMHVPGRRPSASVTSSGTHPHAVATPSLQGAPDLASSAVMPSRGVPLGTRGEGSGPAASPDPPTASIPFAERRAKQPAAASQTTVEREAATITSKRRARRERRQRRRAKPAATARRGA